MHLHFLIGTIYNKGQKSRKNGKFWVENSEDFLENVVPYNPKSPQNIFGGL